MGLYNCLKQTICAIRQVWSLSSVDKATSESAAALLSEKNSQDFNENECENLDIAPPAYVPQSTPAPDQSTVSLHHAAFTGDISQASANLYNPEIDVNTTDKNGYTALLYAAQKGRTGVVQRLLKYSDVNVNPCDLLGISALSWAARRGHLEIVQLLLETPGVIVDQRCKKGRTPLFRAAMKGHEKVVEALLKVPGVDIDVKDSTGSTPLLLASQSGHEKVVALLLQVSRTSSRTTKNARVSGSAHKCPCQKV